MEAVRLALKVNIRKGHIRKALKCALDGASISPKVNMKYILVPVKTMNEWMRNIIY